jgi:hypothetical protein
LAGEREGARSLVYGMIGDGVEAIDIVASGRAVGAQLGDNGFAARLALHSFDDLEAVVLHRRDGTTERIDLP